MKTNLLSAIVVAGTLASGASVGFAQAPANQPSPVISSPQPAPESQSSSQPESTRQRISSAVENFLGKFIKRDQANVSFDQLPPAVQNTVRAEAGTAPVESVSQVDTNGQSAYLVTINRNGQNQTFEVDSSGRIINPASPNMGNVISRPPAPVRDWRTAPVRQPLSQARNLDFRSVPQPVRDTFVSYAKGSPVDNVQQGFLGGQSIYQAQLRPNDQIVDLRVAENGSVIDDQVNDRFLAQFAGQPSRTSGLGQAPGWQTGSSSSANAPLNNLVSVSFNQLPVAVQTTVDGQVSGARIDSISEGTLNGRTVYDVTYNRGGQPVTLRVGDDGSILSSPLSIR